MDYSYILPVSFSHELVLLSFVVAFVGAYAALLATDRMRAADGSLRIGVVCLAALCLGGIGIWGMHLVGMRAQWLPFTLHHRFSVMMLSLIVAVGFSGFALWLAASGGNKLACCVIAGGLAGLGMVSMHYTGIAGASMPILGIQWKAHSVALSAAIAILSSMLAMWLAFFTAGNRLVKILGALCLAGGVCGMHYTAMMGANLICYANTVPTDEAARGSDALFVALMLCGGLLFIGLLWRSGSRSISGA